MLWVVFIAQVTTDCAIALNLFADKTVLVLLDNYTLVMHMRMLFNVNC